MFDDSPASPRWTRLLALLAAILSGTASAQLGNTVRVPQDEPDLQTAINQVQGFFAATVVVDAIGIADMPILGEVLQLELERRQHLRVDEVAQLGLADRWDDEMGGLCIVFVDGTPEARQQALATVTRHTIANVHQFALPSLVGERRMQTQSSLRKAFDAASEEGALLFFNEVDMLFDWRHPDTLGGEEEPTSVEYFFQRVEAFEGVIVLALNDPEHIETAREYGARLIVDFR